MSHEQLIDVARIFTVTEWFYDRDGIVFRDGYGRTFGSLKRVARSEISDFRFQISDFRFQISDLRSQISDLRFERFKMFCSLAPVLRVEGGLITVGLRPMAEVVSLRSWLKRIMSRWR